MEGKFDNRGHCSNATIDKNCGNGRIFRNVPPAHYIFEIQSFSTLLKTKVEKYETKDFEAGGYDWRMILYPNGKKKEDGNRSLSLFLAMTGQDDVSVGWEVHIIANFFVFDGIRDRYLVVRDADRIDWRFHKMKMEWGFDEFLHGDFFFEPSNGFLVDDRCIFGVEVFVIKSCCEGESLSFVEEPAGGLYTWKIENFSALNKADSYSKVFIVEQSKWKLTLYPNGDSKGSGTHLSLSLRLDGSETLQKGQKLYASYLLRIKDQRNHNHCEDVGNEDWFCASEHGFCFSKFISLSALKDPSNDYLVNDCMIIEVKFDLVSVVKDLSSKKID